LIDNFRRAVAYADRILKGTKPSEPPVQAPVKFDMTVNVKTAQALGPVALIESTSPKPRSSGS
jgi:putative ABC transport system substrate-binding protein